MRQHHERHALVDAARKGTRSGAIAVRIVAGPSSVFTVGAPRPGKCLAVAATRASRRPRTAARVLAAISRCAAGERAGRHDRAGARHIGDRSEVHPHPGRPELPAGGPRHAPHLARRALEGLALLGPGVGDRPDRAALLVDHDQRAAVPASWSERVRRRHWARLPPLAPNRITPAVSRARSRRRMYSGRAVP